MNLLKYSCTIQLYHHLKHNYIETIPFNNKTPKCFTICSIVFNDSSVVWMKQFLTLELAD